MPPFDMLQIILVSIFFLPICIPSKGEWSYENIGKWGDGDAHYCKGINQSPIDLYFNIARYNHHLKQIYFQKHESNDSLELVNNGHTAQLNFKKHYVLKGLSSESGDYKVAQLHFHWGHRQDNHTGSEHLLEGRSYPLEMHVVTYSNVFTNVTEAVTNTRALAVVGLFFEVSDKSNEHLQPLVDRLRNIQHKDQTDSMSPDSFDLINLIGPDNLRRYYRYDGSLTTPPCYESVIWTVVQQPSKISLDQLDAFRNLYAEKNKLMKNTYRPPQKLGTRKLYRSFKAKNSWEEPPETTRRADNYGRCLSMNMKVILIFISFLIIIV